MQVRPLHPTDLDAVVELANTDRLIGQPPVTPRAILDTLARHSPVDQSFHDELTTTEILVATDDLTPDHPVVGALAYGDMPETGGRDILWIEARDDRATVDALLAAALEGHTGPARAFWYASSISAGLEGLPVVHRPVTYQALLDAGFTGTDLWSYQWRTLPSAHQPTLAPTLWESHRGEVVDHDTPVATFELALVAPRMGVLWWLEVHPLFRGRGYGHAALAAALDTLASLGADQVILYVDDDAEPNSARSRAAAKALYAANGFVQVDRLWSFTRPAQPQR